MVNTKIITKKCIKTGVAEVDDNDKIIKLTEKPKEPKSNWACPPFYYYTKQDAKLVKKGIEEGCGVDAPGILLHGFALKRWFMLWKCQVNATI